MYPYNQYPTSFNQFGNNSNNYNNGGFNSAANNPGLFDPPMMNSSPYPPPAAANHQPYENSGSIGFGFGAMPTPYPNQSYNNYPTQPTYPSYPPQTQQPVYPSYPPQNNYFPSQPTYPTAPIQKPYSPELGGFNAPPSPYQPSNVPPPPSYQPSSSSSNLYPTLPNQNMTNNAQQFNQVNQHVNASPYMSFNPTLRPHQPFDPSNDAARLYKAMKGIGTDEITLIDVLCKRTSQQRQEIALAYKTAYGKDLVRNLESETSGNFKNVLKALMMTPLQLEAYYLRNSIEGLGTDENSLIDVVCTKSNSEMMELKNIYRQTYGKNLEEEVKDDVSGYFKRFLVSLMAGHRSNSPPDYQKAVAQAKELYDAGERRLGTNEVVFNRIFASESYAHLRLVFDEYYKLTRHQIEHAIKSEMSTSVERAFLTVAQFSRNPSAFYAQRLYESMKGLGTTDKTLVRVMVLRSEIDMNDIKTEFQKMYKQSLESFIKGDTSGDYRRSLLCLAGYSNWK